MLKNGQSGYTDWCLPSIEESVYFSKVNELNKGNFNIENIYHSSSEIDPYRFGNNYNTDYTEYKMALSLIMNAYSSENWNNGKPDWRFFGAIYKDNQYLPVRAIRYF